MSFQLTGTDFMGSIMLSMNEDDTTQYFSYSPYGSTQARATNSFLPGFNGERIDPVSGTTHLGNGYRAYNPILMRFNCPDSMSPFGDGGINPYAYCDGDPINSADPSGHMSNVDIVGLVVSIISVVLGLYSFYKLSKIAFRGLWAIEKTLRFGIQTAGAAMDIISAVTGIAGTATEYSNPDASNALLSTSVSTGLVGTIAGASMRVDEMRYHKKHNIENKKPKNLKMIETGLWLFEDKVNGEGRLNIMGRGKLVGGENMPKILYLGHGSNKEGGLINGKDMGKFLKEEGHITKDTKHVRVVSSFSGLGDDRSFAQRLSNEIDLPVKGFENEICYTDPAKTEKNLGFSDGRRTTVNVTKEMVDAEFGREFKIPGASRYTDYTDFGHKKDPDGSSSPYVAKIFRKKP